MLNETNFVQQRDPAATVLFRLKCVFLSVLSQFLSKSKKYYEKKNTKCDFPHCPLEQIQVMTYQRARIHHFCSFTVPVGLYCPAWSR